MNEIKMAMIFNEWADRYAKDPQSYMDILGADGKPISNYGEACARFFYQIEFEMKQSGLLPE